MKQLFSWRVCAHCARAFDFNAAWMLVFLMLVCAATAPAQDVFSPQNVRIINPGKVLNHEGLDYAPTIAPDGKTLYFVSNRPGSKKSAKGAFSHDFWSTTKPARLDTLFSLPSSMDTLLRPKDNGLNTALNEGVSTIAANRRTMYFTGCDRPDVLRKKKRADGEDVDYACDIYVVELNEKGEWGIPRNLGAAVNSEDWDSQPSISPDGSRLYFASNRPGGAGDVDIWYSDYDFQRRVWLPAKNAGKTINTPYKDWSPFMAANNRELFFASDGHTPNYGGTDFYVSIRDGKDQWSKPRNLGKPINTDADESFICTPASRDILYFASQRTDIPNYQGSFDVFMAFVPKSSLSLAIPITGMVLDGCSNLNTTATVSMYNPITRRTFRDTLDGKKRVTFETILNDFDFGSLEKPADTLNLTITAENKQFGTLTRPLRIIRPKPAASGIYENIAEIPPVLLKYGSQPELAATLQKTGFAARPSTTKLLASGFNGLVLEEIVSVSVNRVLNYVFFESGSDTIPERYVLLSSPEDAKKFDEEKLRGETLDKYYNTLNIFGYRLQRNPKSVITIAGCNDQSTPAEKRPALAKSRAQRVFDYLKTVWGISEKRMKVRVDNLPNVPSNREDSLGIAENRRVEILCDDWEIVKPTVDRNPIVSAAPPTVSFALSSQVPPQQQGVSLTLNTAPNLAGSTKTPNTMPNTMRRKLVVMRGNQVWKIFDTLPTTGTITWNWKNDAGEFPEGDTPLTAYFSVIDQAGRECLSHSVNIPVKRISTDDKRREKTADKTLERYNLIMFPFDKSDVGPMNSRILKEYVLPRMFPSSETLIVGHTDVIGADEYNATLSTARGAKAKDELAKLAQGKYKTLDSKGVGEIEPLFPNSLPEGRFYNRTVQVIIETPIEDAVGQEK